MKMELLLRTIYKDCVDEKVMGWPVRSWLAHAKRRRVVENTPTDELSRLLNLQLREEDFGGICYDPCSTAVFLLDKEAYEVLSNFKSTKNLEVLRPLYPLLRKYRFID